MTEPVKVVIPPEAKKFATLVRKTQKDKPAGGNRGTKAEDLRTAIIAVRELTRLIDLLGRLRGELQNAPTTINVQVLAPVILGALEGPKGPRNWSRNQAAKQHDGGKEARLQRHSPKHPPSPGKDAGTSRSGSSSSKAPHRPQEPNCTPSPATATVCLRRTRHAERRDSMPAHPPGTREPGVWIVAMATASTLRGSGDRAGVTDHVWTIDELLMEAAG